MLECIHAAKVETKTSDSHVTISNNYAKVDLKSTEDYQLPSSAMRRGLKNHAQNPFSAMRRQRKYRTVLSQPKQWMIKIIHPNRIAN